MSDTAQQRRRRRILERDGGRCYLCRVVLYTPKKGCGEKVDGRVRDDLFTLDHVIPRSAGGTSALDNLRACCYGCNQRKDNQVKPGHIPSLRRPSRSQIMKVRRANNKLSPKASKEARYAQLAEEVSVYTSQPSLNCDGALC